MPLNSNSALDEAGVEGTTANRELGSAWGCAAQ